LDEARVAGIYAPGIKRERRTLWLASRDRPVSSRPPIDVQVSRRTAAAEAAQAAEAQAAEAQADAAQTGEAQADAPQTQQLPEPGASGTEASHGGGGEQPR